MTQPKDTNKQALRESQVDEWDNLIQVLGDICHQKYMGCTKSRNTGITNHDWDYSYTDEVVNMLSTPEAKAAITALRVRDRLDELSDIQISDVDTVYHVERDEWMNIRRYLETRIAELESQLNTGKSK